MTRSTQTTSNADAGIYIYIYIKREVRVLESLKKRPRFEAGCCNVSIPARRAGDPRFKSRSRQKLLHQYLR